MWLGPGVCMDLLSFTLLACGLDTFALNLLWLFQEITGLSLWG